MAKRKPVYVGNGVYRLELTHGHCTFFDECDLGMVLPFTWFAHLRDKKPSWYASGYVDGRFVRMHRYILGLAAGDKRQVDHADGDQGNNRRCNLRLADNVENNRNRRTAVGQVGFKGVSRFNDRYRAAITVHGKRIYLGTFADAVAASAAYDAAALAHFGAFAATNASLGLLSEAVR